MSNLETENLAKLATLLQQQQQENPAVEPYVALDNQGKEVRLSENPGPSTQTFYGRE